MNELSIPESAEMDMQMRAANMYPRDLETFTEDCTALACKSMAVAASCIYCRPVGWDKKKQVMNFATGPSVRLTEIMQQYWKHLYSGYRIVDTGNKNKIKVQGVCIDMQSNVRRFAEIEMDVTGWSENQKNLMKEAKGSIVVRNAMLKAIGRAYADEVMDSILKQMFGSKSIQEWWKSIVTKWKDMGVSEAQVKKLVGANGEFEFKKELTEQEETKARECIFRAIGIYNYLRDSGDTAEYVFGEGNVKSSKPKVGVKTKDSPRSSTIDPIVSTRDKDIENMIAQAIATGASDKEIMDYLKDKFNATGTIIPDEHKRAAMSYLKDIVEAAEM